MVRNLVAGRAKVGAAATYSYSASVLAAVVCAAIFAAGTSARAASAGQEAAAAADGDLYTAKVQPIFKNNCYKCHAGMFHRGGLKLDTAANILKGGHDGVDVVPGHPEQSVLVKLIRHEGPANDPKPMPPHSKLSDEDIAVVEKWIKAGALMPVDPAPAAPTAQVGADPSK